MQVHLKDMTALLVGDGQDAGMAIAARLQAAGARLAQQSETQPLDLSVMFLQDGKTLIERWGPSADRIAAMMNAGGAMLNVVSVTGLVAMRGDDSAPMQAAAMAFTRGLALELAPRGIRVNALAIVAGPEAARRMVSHSPDGRVPDAAAVADAALFLLDPENSYTTGHVLVADGGWSIGYGRDF